MADLLVEEITAHDEQQVADLVRLCAAWFQPETACSPWSTWPEWNELRDAILVPGRHLYVAWRVNQPVGLVIAREPDGLIGWLRTAPGLVGEVCTAIAGHIADQFGSCWGKVNNDAVRAAVVAAADGRIVDETETQILRWVG